MHARLGNRAAGGCLLSSPLKEAQGPHIPIPTHPRPHLQHHERHAVRVAAAHGRDVAAPGAQVRALAAAASGRGRGAGREAWWWWWWW